MPAPTNTPPTPKLDAPFSSSSHRKGSREYNLSTPSLRNRLDGRRAIAAEEAQKWWDKYLAAEQQKRIDARPENVRNTERSIGLSDIGYLLGPSYQPSFMEEIGLGAEEGATRLGQLASGILASLGSKTAEDRRQMYQNRADILSAARNRIAGASDVPFTTGDVLNFGVSRIPEYVNPAGGASLAAKGTNALWHAFRGFAPEQSMTQAALSVGANLAGEKLEDAITFGKGVTGNLGGTVMEETGNKLVPAALRDYLDSLFREKKSSP